MQPLVFQNARFLILDDEPINIAVLTQMLKQWNASHIVGITNPYELASQVATFNPDIILLDLMMPGMDGVQVMEQLKHLVGPDDFVPVLVLTADNTGQAKRRALTAGATDFLTKPFDATELSLRLHNLLSRRFLHRRLQDQNRVLDQQVRERTEQLAQAEIDTADCLAMAAEYRDDDTGQHTKRVGYMAARLAYALGMDKTEVALIERAAPLHDVGKIGIPDHILLKPDKLTAEEFTIVKTHTTIGAAILARHHTPLLRLAASVALSHHERWDGRGYPQGLVGNDINIAGRIVAVADVFDALTHERPYKKAWPVPLAVAEIEKGAGTQFDPCVVKVFLDLHYNAAPQELEAA